MQQYVQLSQTNHAVLHIVMQQMLLSTVDVWWWHKMYTKCCNHWVHSDTHDARCSYQKYPVVLNVTVLSTVFMLNIGLPPVPDFWDVPNLHHAVPCPGKTNPGTPNVPNFKVQSKWYNSNNMRDSSNFIQISLIFVDLSIKTWRTYGDSSVWH